MPLFPKGIVGNPFWTEVLWSAAVMNSGQDQTGMTRFCNFRKKIWL